MLHVCLCDAVERGERAACDGRQQTIKSTSKSGYFTSWLAEERGAGSSVCPWMIEARSGQRINVTLYNFASASASDAGVDEGGRGGAPRPSYGPLRPDVCFEIAVLRDGDLRKPVTVCGDENRQVPLLWSRSNAVSIELPNPKLVQSLGTFVFHYQGNDNQRQVSISLLM